MACYQEPALEEVLQVGTAHDSIGDKNGCSHRSRFCDSAGLMLLACYFCYRWGHRAGIIDTLDVLESEGVLERADAEEEK